jgi:phage-related minor tail protein
MAKAKKKSSRGREQDRARVAGGQDEVRYEAKKTRKSASAVKKAVKKVGSSRKRVERRLGR